jgi:hypothetical protein
MASKQKEISLLLRTHTEKKIFFIGIYLISLRLFTTEKNIAI